MTTIDEAKNMRTSSVMLKEQLNVKKKLELSIKSGSTVDVANAYLVDNGMEIKITLWAEDAKIFKMVTK